MRSRKSCLYICGLFLLLCVFSLCMAACDGIGSSRRGDFPTYPGVSDSSSGTSSGSNSYGIFGPGMSGGDLFTLANSGDIAAITEALSETTTISFSSSAIGLSAGGSVTLMITGNGIAYTAEASDAGDGFVYFTIPKIANGTVITVSIIVRNQDGSVACAGSETQTVTNDAHDIHVSLIGDSDGPWTLPASIPVSASPTSVNYNPSAAPAQTVDLAVVGLADPPSGSLSYAWTNAQGAPIGTDADAITVSVTDIIGVDPATLPAGNSTLSVGLVLTYTDDDGNTQTATGTCPVQVTIHKIPSFTLEVDTPLPAGVTAHSGSGYDVADTSQLLAVKAVASSGFESSTTFVWTVNGTTLPDTLATAYIPLSSLTSLSTTSASSLTISCQAIDPLAANSPSPTTPVSETLDFYKPTLPTPVINAPTTSNGTYIGVEGTTYSFYAKSSGSAYDTLLGFSTSSTGMPSGTTFNWKVDGSSLVGDGGPATMPERALGDLYTSSMPATLTVTCTAICPGYESVTSDPITVKVLAYPSSVPDFHVYIDSYPGQVYGTGSQCYDVVNDSIIGPKLSENGVSTGGLPPNGAASFAWTANGTAVKTTTNQEAILTVGEVLAALGTSVSALPNYDSTMLAAPSGGLEVEIQCTITVTISGVSKSSTVSSLYDPNYKVTLYR